MQKDNIITLLLSVISSVVVSVLLTAAITNGHTNTVVQSADEATEAAPKNLDKAIEDFLMANPEKIQEALNLAAQKEQEAAQKRISELYVKHWEELKNNKHAPFVGPKNAKITIVEFYDFNCGYCKRLAPELMKVIKANPDVKFVFKPVTFLGSMPIAKAAMAANAKGKFLPMYEALLTHEGRVDNKVIEDTFKKLGLNVAEMKKLMESDEVSTALREISTLSEKIQIRGVPTLIINGKPLQSIDQGPIQAAIDELK